MATRSTASMVCVCACQDSRYGRKSEMGMGAGCVRALFWRLGAKLEGVCILKYLDTYTFNEPFDFQ
jgi:hypothetical protein